MYKKQKIKSDARRIPIYKNNKVSHTGNNGCAEESDSSFDLSSCESDTPIPIVPKPITPDKKIFTKLGFERERHLINNRLKGNSPDFSNQVNFALAYFDDAWFIMPDCVLDRSLAR